MEISTNKQTETVAATQEKLSLKEKISYGFGDFGNGFMFDLGQLYLLKFFTVLPVFRRRQPEAFFL